MVKKIALEEHFLDPATEPYWRPTMVDVAPAKTAQLYACLTDFSEQRLQMMDKTGIARAILSIAGPGVQAERD
ncbi:MAG: amidohydrolase, partial [Pseudolabrys sp.]